MMLLEAMIGGLRGVSGGGTVGHGHRDLQGLVAAQHGQLYVVARFGVMRCGDEILGRRGVVTVERGDEIAGPDAGVGGRAWFTDGENNDTAVAVDPEALCEPCG